MKFNSAVKQIFILLGTIVTINLYYQESNNFIKSECLGTLKECLLPRYCKRSAVIWPFTNEKPDCFGRTSLVF
jgi:hypothetical protein